jgi:hypothetical protein
LTYIIIAGICPKGIDPFQEYTDYRTITVTTTATSTDSNAALAGSFTFIFQDQYLLFPANGNAWNNQLCKTALEKLKNVGTVECIQSSISTHGAATYTIQFKTWPLFPYENNIYAHNGYPLLTQFQCHSDLVSEVDSVSCSVTDVEVKTFPSKLLLIIICNTMYICNEINFSFYVFCIQ